MYPIQELSFHLSSNEVIFAQLMEHPDESYSAGVTVAHSLDELPAEKLYHHLACPSNANAKDAFQEVVDAIHRKCRKESSVLLKVNNPLNCELLTDAQQKTVLGENVNVTVNEKI